MKDRFGNTQPIPLNHKEWWFNGNVIRHVSEPVFSKYIVYPDNEIMKATGVPDWDGAIRICIQKHCNDSQLIFENDNPMPVKGDKGIYNDPE